jgi:hypothetical protein
VTSGTSYMFNTILCSTSHHLQHRIPVRSRHARRCLHPGLLPLPTALQHPARPGCIVDV